MLSTKNKPPTNFHYHLHKIKHTKGKIHRTTPSRININQRLLNEKALSEAQWVKNAPHLLQINNHVRSISCLL